MANDPDTRVAGPDPSRARPLTGGSDFASNLTAELPRLSRLALHLTRDPVRAEDVAYYAGLIVVMLFVTIRVVESYRWR